MVIFKVQNNEFIIFLKVNFSNNKSWVIGCHLVVTPTSDN